MIVGVREIVGVKVRVGVRVIVKVRVGVYVSVAVLVLVGVLVIVGVRVGVRVFVGVDVAVLNVMVKWVTTRLDFPRLSLFCTSTTSVYSPFEIIPALIPDDPWFQY